MNTPGIPAVPLGEAARTGVGRGSRRWMSTDTPRTASPEHGEPDPDPRRRGVAVAVRDDDATEPGPERVRRVEGGVVARRGERLGRAGDLHEAELEVDDEDRGEHRGQQETTSAGTAHCAVRANARGSRPSPTQPMVIDRSTDHSPSRPASEVADEAADAGGEQEDRDRAGVEAGDVGDRRRDVALHREHATEADGADGERQRHLSGREALELALDRALDVARDVRDVGEEHADGEHPEHGDEPVGRAPAVVLPEPGGAGHAGDVGDRDAEHDRAHRAAGRPAGARSTATRAATPKKAPCGSPATKRATTSHESRAPARSARCRWRTRP